LVEWLAQSGLPPKRSVSKANDVMEVVLYYRLSCAFARLTGHL